MGERVAGVRVPWRAETAPLGARLTLRAAWGCVSLQPLPRSAPGVPQRWALPGRSTVTLAELRTLCVIHRWPPPEIDDGPAPALD